MTAIIIDNAGGSPIPTPVITDASRIGGNNLIDNATLSASTNVDQLDALRDNMTNIYWTADGPSRTVTALLAGEQPINWIGIAGGNWAETGCLIQVYVGNTLVGEISGLKDDDPFMWVFDTRISDLVIFVFQFTGTIRVGEIGAGATLNIPCLPSIGMQWGAYNNDDEIIGRKTENNIFASSSVLPRARTSIMNFELTPIEWVRTTWTPFSNTKKGRLIWFMWDVFAHPYDVAFGHWNAAPIAYDRSTYANLNLEIMGDIR